MFTNTFLFLANASHIVQRCQRRRKQDFVGASLLLIVAGKPSCAAIASRFVPAWTPQEKPHNIDPEREYKHSQESKSSRLDSAQGRNQRSNNADDGHNNRRDMNPSRNGESSLGPRDDAHEPSNSPHDAKDNFRDRAYR